MRMFLSICTHKEALSFENYIAFSHQLEKETHQMLTSCVNERVPSKKWPLVLYWLMAAAAPTFGNIISLPPTQKFYVLARNPLGRKIGAFVGEKSLIFKVQIQPNLTLYSNYFYWCNYVELKKWLRSSCVYNFNCHVPW